MTADSVQAGVQCVAVWLWFKKAAPAVLCCFKSHGCWRANSDRSIAKLDSKAGLDQSCKHAAEVISCRPQVRHLA